MSIQVWAHFFKPEVRNQGEKHFANGDVFLKIKADTQIQAYVKNSSPIRIFFKTSSIASPHFSVSCSCPQFKKGQFCKHIWATLIAVENEFSDFLDSKKEFDRASTEQEKTSTKKELSEAEVLRIQKQSEQKQKLKERQSDYRKTQYQKQKLKTKERKLKQKDPKNDDANLFPDSVQRAVDFFKENGFAFIEPIDPNEVANARKILSRVFHPDKGGTHEEVLTLNANYDILMKWTGN